MIRLLNDVKGSAVRATNGDVGKVTDCYFDDERWAIRYLVVDVGNLVPGGVVLISPISMVSTDWENHIIKLNIDRQRVTHSPTPDIVRPVSRQFEAEYYRYHGWPNYWEGMGIWGTTGTPDALGAIPPPSTTAAESYREPGEQTVGGAGADTEESRLRSARQVAGYHIKATDQEVGHIDDYLVDPDNWTIHSIVVDTSNWPGGRAVVLPRERIDRVDWSTRQIFVSMTSEDVRRSPEFSDSALSRRL